MRPPAIVPMSEPIGVPEVDPERPEQSAELFFGCSIQVKHGTRVLEREVDTYVSKDERVPKQGIEASPSIQWVTTTRLSEPLSLAQTFRQSGMDVLKAAFSGGQGFRRLDGIDDGKVLSSEP